MLLRIIRLGCCLIIMQLSFFPYANAQQNPDMFGSAMAFYAERYAEQSGYPLSQQNANEIFSAFSTSPPDSINANTIRGGKDIVETLIDQMIAERLSRGGGPGDVLGESTLRQALATLCPFFPFC